MTLDQLDQLLAEWNQRMDAASRNLVELHGMPSYEMLTGTSNATRLRLTGATQKRIAPAVSALDELMRDFETLSNTIGRATDLRKQMPRFSGVEQKVREVEYLLLGPSIPVSEISAGFQDGDLVTPGSKGRFVTPAQLLQRMNDVFLQGRTGLMELDGYWKRLEAKLAPINTFLSSNRSETAAGVPALREKVDAVRAQVMGDPLGANERFDREIASLFPQVQMAIDKLAGQRAGLREDLARGRELLQKANDLRRENEFIYAECKEKITGYNIVPAPPFPANKVQEFGEWLSRLEQKSGEGLIDPVCVGLEKCVEGLKELVERETAALARNQKPLELRRELRGRLSALKAKASARGIAEDAHLVETAGEADHLLHLRPTPLDEASRLVSRYEARMNGRVVVEGPRQPSKQPAR